VNQNRISIAKSLREYWKRERESAGRFAVARGLALVGWEFLRDSLPSRQRRLYGDIDYDWAFRVDTTAATVSWRSRLLGLLHSAYQPIEPELFREMVASLRIDCEHFTFIDVGSGKGRALLLASEYPFQRVVGLELLAELNSVAEENIRKIPNEKRACREIQTVCGDATEFIFPVEPLLVFLFNPLPESGLRKLVGNLCGSIRAHPRPVYVIYANPVHQEIVGSSTALSKVGGTHQYSVFQTEM